MFLVIFTACIYWQIRHHEPINADDFYITQNIHLDTGFSYQAFVDTMTKPTAGVWMPIVYLIVGINVELFGTDFGAFRMVTMSLHALNAMILFLLLTRLTGAFWRSALAAALFAVHPINVESVAWLAGIRVVQSGFFSLLSVYFYALYVHHRSSLYYTLALSAYVISLISVPMFVPLPFLLLLLDFWPLDRLGIKQKEHSLQNISLPKIGRAVWEKFPFFGIMTVFFIMLLFSHDLSASPGIDRYPFHERLFNALLSYVLYMRQILLPTDLAIFYPFPENFPLWKVTGAVSVLTIITVFSLIHIRRAPYLIIGWLWFSGMLFPLSGLAQIGSQARADHYTYIPMIGLLIMLCWGGAALAERLKIPRPIVLLAAIPVIALSAGLARQQAGHWKNSFTIMNHALQVTKNNYEAHNYLGQAAATRGDLETAVDHFKQALAIKPDHLKSHINLANTFHLAGRTDQAIDYFVRAVEIDPHDARLHNNLGVLYEKSGNTRAALEHYRQAVAIHPRYAAACENLAALEADTGDLDSAITHFRQALRLRPRSAETHFRLAWTLHQAEQNREALNHIQQALDIEPWNRQYQQFMTFIAHEAGIDPTRSGPTRPDPGRSGTIQDDP